MRKIPFFLLVCCLVGGCGGSSTASSKSAPSATPTIAAPQSSDTIPGLTPTKRKHATALPTPNKAVALPSFTPLPTPTSFPPSAYTAQVQGRVLDAKDHSPIAGATVYLGAHLKSTTTDGLGHYSLKFPAGPPVPVFVLARGYSGALAMGKLQARKTATVDFVLKRVTQGQPPVPPMPKHFGKP